eukprot:4426236-Pyramimonas_sp.AAC.1
MVTVRVTFPGYGAGRSLSATATAQLVVLDDLTVEARPFPTYTGSAAHVARVLNQVHCSGKYQRATLEAVANLTDGSTFDVREYITASSSRPNVVVLEGLVL